MSPAAASVVLNGSPLDRSQIGVPIRLDRGEVVVEVRAAGFETARESITIVGGKRESRAFALVPGPPPAVASAVQAGGSPAGGSEAPSGAAGSRV